MRYFTALALLIGLGIVPSTVEANSACPTNVYKRADASLFTAKSSWRSLLRHYQMFIACDDGALAEGHSDAVVNLLAHRWGRFSEFVALSRRHPSFRRWAIRHIDATTSNDDLSRVVRNAAKCADNVHSKGLCGKVQKAATDALAEQSLRE